MCAAIVVIVGVSKFRVKDIAQDIVLYQTLLDIKGCVVVSQFRVVSSVWCVPL